MTENDPRRVAFDLEADLAHAQINADLVDLHAVEALYVGAAERLGMAAVFGGRQAHDAALSDWLADSMTSEERVAAREAQRAAWQAIHDLVSEDEIRACANALGRIIDASRADLAAALSDPNAVAMPADGWRSGFIDVNGSPAWRTWTDADWSEVQRVEDSTYELVVFADGTATADGVTIAAGTDPAAVPRSANTVLTRMARIEVELGDLRRRLEVVRDHLAGLNDEELVALAAPADSTVRSVADVEALDDEGDPSVQTVETPASTLHRSPHNGLLCCRCDWGGYWRTVEPHDEIEAHDELLAKLNATTAAELLAVIEEATIWEARHDPGEGGIPPWDWADFALLHSFNDPTLTGRLIQYVQEARADRRARESSNG